MASKPKFTDHLLWVGIAVITYIVAVWTSPVWVLIPMWMHRKSWLEDRVTKRDQQTISRQSAEARRASQVVM